MEPTTIIEVPAVLVPRLLEVAKILDAGEEVVITSRDPSQRWTVAVGDRIIYNGMIANIEALRTRSGLARLKVGGKPLKKLVPIEDLELLLE